MYSGEGQRAPRSIKEFDMKNRQSVVQKLTTALAIVALTLVTFGGQASASPNGFIESTEGVGYFYGTFNQSPNIVLLAGGDVQQFCDSYPGDPGTAPGRVFLRSGGVVDIKVNDKNQPIYLYKVDFDGAPEWLESVCGAYFNGHPLPAAFASGTADLKVRVTVISENYVDVFNSINGKATGTDGSRYKVRATADLVIENGMPVGNPEDFVGFKLQKIKR